MATSLNSCSHHDSASRRRSGRIASQMRPQDEESHFETVVHTNGDINIIDQDPNGKYVSIQNRSDQEIALGNFVLLQTADELTTRYKFRKDFVIKPLDTVSVWSSDANAIHRARAYHRPPESLVMVCGTWAVGDLISTSLVNALTNEVGCCIHFYQFINLFCF